MYKVASKRWQSPLSYSYKTGTSSRIKLVPLFFVVSIIACSVGVLTYIGYGKKIHTIIQAKKATSVASQSPQSTVPLAKPLVVAAADTETSYFDEELQTIMQQWSDDHKGQDWSVVVQGLGTDGRYASIRGDSWYVPASIYKLYATYTLFQHNKLDELNNIHLQVDNADTTLGKCVDKMLRNSDNPCGEAVGAYLGWWRIEEDAHKLGLKNTYVNRKDTMFSTAADAALFMSKLYSGDLYGERETNYVLGILQHQQFRAGIPKGCTDCAVADKTGDLTNVRHDAAIVQTKDETYVLSIFTSGASYSQIAELTSLINNHMVK